MARFAEYRSYGGPEVIEVVEADAPVPGPGEVRVRVRAAGLNPVDYMVFGSEQMSAAFGSGSLPGGIGNDFAGVVDALGDGVTGLTLGEGVFGGARGHAVADYTVVPADELERIPAGLSFEVAGALAIAGRTAVASVRQVALTAADTVFVSAAAGGVGILAAQLATKTGATVVGTASEANHEFLRGLGVVPVAYGDGLVDRLRDAAPGGYTAALDNHGQDSVEAALALGIPAARVNSIAAHGFPGITNVGGALARPGDLLAVAEQLARGELVLPIAVGYPLEETRQAYERLLERHVLGKIVIVTE